MKNRLTVVEVAVAGKQIQSLSQLSAIILDNIQDDHDVPLHKLSSDTKANIVRSLDSMGFMSIRGAVIYLSRRLNVTRKCIYNWINDDRKY